MIRGSILERFVTSLTVSERVVQRCLCDYSLVPMLTRTFIYDNGASLNNKGYSFATHRIVRHLRHYYRKNGNNGYVLLFDFSSFFDSIPHDLIEKIIRKEYADEKLINLIMHFVGMFGECGLGLGSQISQVLALASANSLDHFIKETLGIKYYGRYMDDGYLIHKDKKYLEKCLKMIAEKCESLGLKLSLKKTMIIPISKNFQWLKIKFKVTETGYVVRRIWHKSVIRMRRKLKKLKKKLNEHILSIDDIKASFQSWVSHTLELDAYKTLLEMKKLYNILFEREVVV